MKQRRRHTQLYIVPHVYLSRFFAVPICLPPIHNRFNALSYYVLIRDNILFNTWVSQYGTAETQQYANITANIIAIENKIKQILIYTGESKHNTLRASKHSLKPFNKNRFFSVSLLVLFSDLSNNNPSLLYGKTVVNKKKCLSKAFDHH